MRTRLGLYISLRQIVNLLEVFFAFGIRSNEIRKIFHLIKYTYVFYNFWLFYGSIFTKMERIFALKIRAFIPSTNEVKFRAN